MPFYGGWFFGETGPPLNGWERGKSFLKKHPRAVLAEKKGGGGLGGKGGGGDGKRVGGGYSREGIWGRHLKTHGVLKKTVIFARGSDFWAPIPAYPGVLSLAPQKNSKWAPGFF